MDGTSIVYLVLLFICIGASAFFSSAETVFIALSKTRLRHLVDTGIHGASRVEKMMEQPEKFLATVLLCNNLVNVATASLGTALAVSIWDQELGILIATIAVTIVLLIFAEVTPKTVALRYSERMALIYVYPLQVINLVFAPIASALSWLATRIAGGRDKIPQSLISEEEIRSMISVGRDEGTVEESEAKLLHKVFLFGDRTAREVMTPRPEVVFIEEGTKLPEFFGIYADFPHTRFPVYQDNIDNVIGILSIKDILMSQAEGNMDRKSVIDELVRPAVFVPETKRIAELFTEMQSQGYNMCIVVDEYGVNTGIVTMEQLVGEIVGEMGDELVKADKDFEVIDDKTVQIDGGMRVEEANEELGLELPDGDYDTVAGFLLHLLGHIPREGEQIRYGGFKIAVTQMRELRVEKILVTKE